MRKPCLLTKLVRTPAILAVLLHLAVNAASAHPGRWSDAVSWNASGFNRYAIHMVLVPGDGNPYHSRILWYRGETPTRFDGGEWGWAPGAIDCASYPGSSFTALPIAGPGMDVFCSGHSTLADGRVFVPGGTDPVTGHYGENKTRIYAPGTGTAAGTWSTPPEMVDWRWYPTATTLPDGRVLTTGGNRHPQHRIFGGRRGGSAPGVPLADSVYRYAPVDGGGWDPSALPALDPTVNPGRPAVREAHTSIEMTRYSNWDGAHVIFGGRGANGLTLNDTWFLLRDNPITGPEFTFRWKRRAKVGPVPQGRGDHVASHIMDSLLVVHGGRNNSGSGLADAWILRLRGGDFEWKEVSAAGTGPGDRFGHGGVHNQMSVRQPDGSMQITSRLIVFGGTASTSSAPVELSRLRAATRSRES